MFLVINLGSLSLLFIILALVAGVLSLNAVRDTWLVRVSNAGMGFLYLLCAVATALVIGSIWGVTFMYLFR